MNKKNLEIERLRAIAVFGVMVAHCHFFSGIISPIFRQGWTGVDLFFVISGYVVTLSLLRLLPDFHIEQNIYDRIRSSLHAVKVFYLRRFFRIIPMALLWSILPLILIYFSIQERYQGLSLYNLLQEIFGILIFNYNYFHIFSLNPRLLGHYWSLSVEEQFYFLLPIFFIFVPDKNKRIKFLGLIIVIIIFILRFIPAPNSLSLEDKWMWTRFASHNRFDALIFGVICYFFTKEIPFKQLIKLSYVAANTITFIFIGFLFITPAIFPSNEANQFNHTLFGLLSLGLVFMAHLETGQMLAIPIIENILNWAGSRSYSLYLVHAPTETFINELVIRKIMLDNQYLKIIAWVTLCFLISEFCHHFIEIPFINFGQKKVQSLFSKS